MRFAPAALTLPLLALAACGGAGGGVASFGDTPPIGGGPVTAGGVPTPSPTGSTGPANMFDVSTATTFDAVGAMHSLVTDENNRTLYQGNASTVATPSGTISYDPRDGIFVMTLADEKAGIIRDVRFQDPRHRTTADPAYVERQVPLLSGFNYLAAVDEDTPLTFFYRRPNGGDSFVSLAGFERNDDTDTPKSSEQGVMVFGARTSNLQTPTSGAAHFDGQMLATMVGQVGNSAPVQQWISGTSSVDVDFGKRTIGLSLSGTVGPAFVKNTPVPDLDLAIPSNFTFNATGSASWGSGSNAFSGKFSSASFTGNGLSTPVDFTSVSSGTSTAGASSIDGTFYGPNAKNIGGNFRIIGGVPRQRVDILGGFIGTKK
jgi:hypothetical protein